MKSLYLLMALQSSIALGSECFSVFEGIQNQSMIELTWVDAPTDVRELLPQLARATGFHPDQVSKFARDVLREGEIRIAYPLNIPGKDVRLVLEYEHLSGRPDLGEAPFAAIRKISIRGADVKDDVVLFEGRLSPGENPVSLFAVSELASEGQIHLNVYPVLSGPILKEYSRFLERFSITYDSDIPMRAQEDLQGLENWKDLKAYRFSMEKENFKKWLKSRGKRQIGNFITFGAGLGAAVWFFTN